MVAEADAKLEAAGAKLDAKMKRLGNAVERSAEQTKENVKEAGRE
jgi:hypothetical protein